MKAQKRTHPKVVVRHRSPNQSARTAQIDGVVLHSTEGHNYPGVKDLVGLGDWFGNPASQVSAHVATDADGTSARFVDDSGKAWHCSSYNSRKLGIEQVGLASQGRWDEAELQETARWLARFAKRHGFPLTHSIERGVCTHADLGAAGGGHHDPGPAYPLGAVIDLGRQYLARL